MVLEHDSPLGLHGWYAGHAFMFITYVFLMLMVHLLVSYAWLWSWSQLCRYVKFVGVFLECVVMSYASYALVMHVSVYMYSTWM